MRVPRDEILLLPLPESDEWNPNGLFLAAGQVHFDRRSFCFDSAQRIDCQFPGRQSQRSRFRQSRPFAESRLIPDADPAIDQRTDFDNRSVATHDANDPRKFFAGLCVDQHQRRLAGLCFVRRAGRSGNHSKSQNNATNQDSRHDPLPYLNAIFNCEKVTDAPQSESNSGKCRGKRRECPGPTATTRHPSVWTASAPACEPQNEHSVGRTGATLNQALFIRHDSIRFQHSPFLAIGPVRQGRLFLRCIA